MSGAAPEPDLSRARRVFDALRTCAMVRTIEVDATGRASVFEGTLDVREGPGGALDVYETGRTRTAEERVMSARSAYRWTLGEDGNTLRLDHLRFGARRPTFLVEFEPAEEGPDAPGAAVALVSRSPHVCGRDEYHARVYCEPASGTSGADGRGVVLTWRVEGPRGESWIESRCTPAGSAGSAPEWQ